MPVYASGSVVMKHRMESHHVSWARNVELSGPVPSHESLACRRHATEPGTLVCTVEWLALALEKSKAVLLDCLSLRL